MIINITSKQSLRLTNCQEFSNLITAICTEDHQEQYVALIITTQSTTIINSGEKKICFGSREESNSSNKIK